MSMRALATVTAFTRPPCADRLELVDAAFVNARCEAAHELAEKVCPGCPAELAAACFMQGITGSPGRGRDHTRNAGEHGVWGGTLSTERRVARGRR